MHDQADLVTIGKIERSFGIRGEARVRSLTDVPRRFEQLGAVTLVGMKGRTIDTRVTHVRPGGSTLIVGFEAFTTPEQVAEFRGGLIQAPRADSPTLPAGHYYECDLIGMVVQDEAGMVLGRLEEIWRLPDHQVFAVRQEGKETLIPAVKQVVVGVDVPNRLMTVRLPKGFEDL
ncbi:16S rRNA processing protein RimM [Nitrospirales bacterium NOB]|nr:MAG: ribosome maturation factor rimM [Nitrospira sp. OLB3]MBV6470311.1 Ribosome maturation factor RimM [Nitrospirota bacterium]MCE7964341.1 16S rRNA processing protein RimM [Nitrospira sp. NTP2]MCK6493337.1 ribosome maturation factor RimM [Nitrospira sp.]MDL1890614.1 16S rRNA processing protein RimM [Nitrospirales bacterium NOB]MEB2337347.1 ribosome maturation factor RimM [Nitrospirales bacterium]